jgi:hypothetical protein
MEKQQAELEISMIKKIMEDSRRIVVDDGIGYIFWGILIFVGMISSYFVVLTKQYSYTIWIWVILIGGGWAYTIISYFLKDSKKQARTLAGKILGGLWVSTGISMTLIGFVGPLSHSIGGYTITPVISIILGIAYFVSGIVYGQGWVRNLAVGWWAGAVVMFFWPGIQMFLIFAAMMLFLQIIPGVIMYSKFKKEFQADKIKTENS